MEADELLKRLSRDVDASRDATRSGTISTTHPDPKGTSRAIKMADLGNTRRRYSTSNDVLRKATLSLVKNGIATVAEAAELAGVDRQLVRYWATSEGYTTGLVRDRYLAEIWRKALKSAQKSS